MHPFAINRRCPAPLRHAIAACIFLSCGGLVPQLASAQGAVTSNAFNPALSLILDGKYSNYSRDPRDYQISGTLLGGEAGLLPEGFSLGETELAASANVDDKFYGQVTLSISDTDEGTDLNIEEAYVQTTTLPEGFTARAGKFFSDIGYQNSRHSHAWDFADQPLVYRALLGEQFGDTGVQIKWVAPTTLFVELGAEAFRGSEFPAAKAANSGTGAYSAFGHVGGDLRFHEPAQHRETGQLGVDDRGREPSDGAVRRRGKRGGEAGPDPVVERLADQAVERHLVVGGVDLELADDAVHRGATARVRDDRRRGLGAGRGHQLSRRSVAQLVDAQ